VVQLQNADALLIVDVQNDFLPGGTLAVPNGDQVIPALNQCIGLFTRHALPIVATRDWHPEHHCSFKDRGGPWPPHCIAGTPGAAFADNLMLPENTVIISKAEKADRDAYSGFEKTKLHHHLQSMGIRRLVVGGLATDFCVLNTVKDGLKLGYRILLLVDAIRAVNLRAGGGDHAIADMKAAGAEIIESAALVDSPGQTLT